MKKVLRIFLTGCILCLVLAVLIGVAGFYFYPPLGKAIRPRVKEVYRTMPLQTSCTVPVPPQEGTLVLIRHGIHPSVSAYEYKLKMTKGATTVERSMSSSSSTSTLVNTYWYPVDQQGGPWIRFQDQEGEILVNIQKQKLFRVLRVKGHVFTGELFSSQEGTAVVESGGRILVSVGRREATEITGLPIADSPGTYIGRIEGTPYRLQFVTPDQSPEKKIRVLE